MPGMFSISHDPDRPLIRVTISGFWSVETVDAYCDALGRAVAATLSQGRRFGLLIDARDYPLQNAEASRHFQERAAQWPAPGDGPLAGVAIIVSSTLNKLQTERTFGKSVTIFQQPEEALKWFDALLHDPDI